MEGLAVTLNKQTSHMTLVQTSMVYDEQEKDVTLQVLIQLMFQGWSGHYNEVNSDQR